MKKNARKKSKVCKKCQQLIAEKKPKQKKKRPKKEKPQESPYTGENSVLNKNGEEMEPAPSQLTPGSPLCGIIDGDPTWIVGGVKLAKGIINFLSFF